MRNLIRLRALLLLLSCGLAATPAAAQRFEADYIYRIAVPLGFQTNLDPVHHRFNVDSQRSDRQSVRSEPITTYRLGFDAYFSKYFSWGLRFLSTGSVYRHLGAAEDTGQLVDYYKYQFDNGGSYMVSGDGRLQVEYKSFGLQAGARIHVLRPASRSHEIFVSVQGGLHFWLRLEGQNYETHEATEETDLETNGLSPYVGLSVVYTNFIGLGLTFDADYLAFGAENALLYPSVTLVIEPTKLYRSIFRIFNR